MNDKIIARFGLISFLATIAIKGVIRPMHLEMNESSQYLVGVLPNFFAATGFCAIFYIWIKAFLIKNNTPNYFVKSIFISIFASFLGLWLWEFIQYAAWDYPMDINDVLASLFGSVLVGTIAYLFGDK